MTQIKNTKKITCLQIIPSMGIGGIETGVRDIANYLKKKISKIIFYVKAVIRTLILKV